MTQSSNSRPAASVPPAGGGQKPVKSPSAPLRPVFTWIWVVLGTAALITEFVALFSKKPGGTLSEHVWKVLKVGDARPTSAVWVGRGVLAVFLVWLLFHFEFGWFTLSDPVPGTSIDNGMAVVRS